MSKKFHPYIAICLLLLFGFLLAESSLHTLIHADHHGHDHLGESLPHADCDHTKTVLNLETDEEVCNLCSEFTGSGTYAISSIEGSVSFFAATFTTALSPSFAGNAGTHLYPTRGPPSA